MKTESYTLKTKFVWVLITDGKPRLAFEDEAKAKAYQEGDIWNGTLHKVYCGVEQVPIGETS